MRAGILFRWIKGQWIYAGLLFMFFVILNSHTFWQLMYPIQYEEEITAASRTFGVDPFLILAVIKVESDFQEDRSSVKGAEGLMQLMPETAEWILEKSGLHRHLDAHRLEPQNNIRLGTWYLAFLLEKYQGDYVKTLAAYNAGQGNVDRWLTAGLWNGKEESLDQIPFGETRHYVKRALFYYERYQKIYADHFSCSVC